MAEPPCLERRTASGWCLAKRFYGGSGIVGCSTRREKRAAISFNEEFQ